MEIIYLVGLPAVGKSTFITKNFPNHYVVSNDIIVEEYAKQHNMKYNEAFGKLSSKEVKRECKKRFNEAIENNYNIVIDNTNLTVRSRQLYEHENYRKVAYVFNISEEKHKQHIEKRLKETGKYVPESVIEQMKNIFVYPSKEEGFDEIINV